MRISRSHTAKQEPGLNSKPSAHWTTLGCHLLNTVQDRNHAHGLVLRDLVSLQLTLAKCLPKAWERSVCLWNQRRDGCYSWNNFILSRNQAELMVHRKDFVSLWNVSLSYFHRTDPRKSNRLYQGFMWTVVYQQSQDIFQYSWWNRDGNPTSGKRKYSLSYSIFKESTIKWYWMERSR